MARSLASDTLEDYLLNSFCGVIANDLELDGNVFPYSETYSKTKKILKGFENGR